MAAIVTLKMIFGNRSDFFRNLCRRSITSSNRNNNQDHKYRTRCACFLQFPNTRTCIKFIYRKTIKISNSSSRLRSQIRIVYRLYRLRSFADFTQVKSRRRRIVLLRSTRIAVLYFTKIRRGKQGANETRNNDSIRNCLSYLTRTQDCRFPFFTIRLFCSRFCDSFVDIHR